MYRRSYNSYIVSGTCYTSTIEHLVTTNKLQYSCTNDTTLGVVTSENPRGKSLYLQISNSDSNRSLTSVFVSESRHRDKHSECIRTFL